METKNFEINGEFRAMDMAELAYILTNQESVSMMVKEQEVVYGNVCTLDEVIYKMTPARKKLALAAIEFYKRGQAALSKYPKVSCSYDVCELPTPKGMSFGENSPLFFPASSCHCFLGHEVVHPQEGSPQA